MSDHHFLYRYGLFILLLLSGMPVWAEKISITINGLSAEAEKTARASLTLSRYATREDVSALVIRHAFTKGRQQIATALQPLGLYHASVSGDIQQAGQQWQATYAVKPGEPTRWHVLDVQLNGQGAQHDALYQRSQQMPFKTGDIVDHRAYTQFKRNLLEQAARYGYLDAQWAKSELRVTRKTHRADAILHFNTGPRYQFGKIEISDTEIDLALIKRYPTFKAGDPFDSDKLLALQYALSDSGYFQVVDIEPQTDIDGVNKTHRIPIKITLTMRPRNKYSAGVGFGTDTGPRIKLGWERRWVNSQGHSMQANIQASGIADRAAVAYTVPLKKPITDQLSFSLSTEREQIPDGESRINRLGMTRQIKRGRWDFRQSLDYQLESFRAGADRGRSRLLMPGVEAAYSTRNHPLIPSRGYKLNLRARAAEKALLSDVTLLHLEADIKWLLPLGDKSRLILRGKAGANLLDSFSTLPTSQRFYTGGDTSVRGYSHRSLSPRDDTGELMGGQYLLTGSVELDRLFGTVFGQPWGLAVFTDAGNAFDEIEEGFKTSAGLGFRLRLPVGHLRLDLAMPLNADDGSYQPRLHLSLGPDL